MAARGNAPEAVESSDEGEPSETETETETETEDEDEAETETEAETEDENEAERAPPVSAEVATSLYVRSDSDGTTVVAPRIHFHQDFGRTGVDLVYTTDVWTSASVDIRTAASPRVSEQRDELDVGVDHERGTWLVGAGYRYSQEADYRAHGPSLSAAWEGLQRNIRLEGRAALSRDRVGRAGDPDFERELTSLAVWLGYTQVLGRGTLLQIAGEHRSSFGYHASPYRWVGLGGPVTCTAQTPLCVPEVVPATRHRYALALRLRQSLARRLSLGVGYRYYIDSWLLQSHTAAGDLRFVPRPSLMISAEYRAYFQGAAWFYSSAYDLDAGPFVTRDRELSSMYDHEFMAALRWTRALSVAAVELGLGVRAGAVLYGYDDFPGLARVVAGEGSVSFSVALR
ncbi:DUF3570 domain-containing protein [Pseudenhygromyxa sp. WMMC2535]|uniref:DUF3570 domain-containing protein n=1 Tax=Pseudenhygromyxa sp. WMMC2535 TaxID=2712867 RepID=UPI0015538978|nr:DUF3570 domain-containing protein [Pseudenhygromyxa sp. WMMC2535]NVB39110.1 DUF3570 domain-containing protein [Pseudenhygromyxa sp. WMMC2535]